MNVKMQELAELSQAKTILLVNTTQDKVLFEMNADEPLPFASITKIITAILALEKAGKPENVYIEMEKRSFEDVRNEQPALTFTIDFIGERFSLLDFLYGCLLESGCEAAQQIAYYVGDGSVERFLKIANGFVKELGCENTHLIDPSGLHDEGHYSTARDISRILRYAMRNPVFRRIVSTCRYQTERFSAEVESTNALILPETGSFFAYAIGGKTGTTTKAGRCLACVFERNGQEYLFVSLGFPMEKNIENKRWFFRNFVAQMICYAFEAEGDFARILLPEHIRKAKPGEQFLLSPVISYQSCAKAPQLRFSSSDEQIASVSPEGMVTVHAHGLTQIEVIAQTGDYDLCFVDSRAGQDTALCRILT